MEVVPTRFYGIAPEDFDVESIENLIKQLLKHFPVDVKQLARLIVEQNYVSTVLKEELDEVGDDDDDTVYGLCTAINLKRKKDNVAVQQLTSLILEKTAKSTSENLFSQVLDLEDEDNPCMVGLLIKEKIINIPGIAMGPLLIQLMNDLEKAKSNGMPYDFTHFIHISKLVAIQGKEDYFVDDEDEIIHELQPCYVDFHYPSSVDATTVLQDEDGTPMNGKAFRRIYLITRSQMTSFMNKIRNLSEGNPVMEEARNSGLQI